MLINEHVKQITNNTLHRRQSWVLNKDLDRHNYNMLNKFDIFIFIHHQDMTQHTHTRYWAALLIEVWLASSVMWLSIS